MKEMSIRARELVTAYDHCLEQQIVGRGSDLVCRNEELWEKVEGLLRDGDAQETHCLGLDPLREMEESLRLVEATTAVNSGQVKRRGGLQGLAKVFEIVEQAALNLYLGPWREEYKIVKVRARSCNNTVTNTISGFHLKYNFTSEFLKVLLSMPHSPTFCTTVQDKVIL